MQRPHLWREGPIHYSECFPIFVFKKKRLIIFDLTLTRLKKSFEIYCWLQRVTKYCNIILFKDLLVQGLTFTRKDGMWMICNVTYGTLGRASCCSSL